MNKLITDFFLSQRKDIKRNSKQEREFIGTLSAMIGIVSNVLLFIIKLIIGIVLNSISIISDSFNNLSDTFSSAVSFYGIKSSSKPADEEHPFGHGRGEYIAGLIVAFFILLVGWEFIQTSIKKIINHEDVRFSVITLAFLIFTILVKIWQYTFNNYAGKRINSKVLLLTAKDSLNDVYITTLTVVSILVTKFTGVVIDGYIGVLLSIMLIWQGYTLVKDTMSPLLGEAADRELANSIKNFIEAYDHVIGTHDLIVHNYGPNSNVCTIHVEVSNELDFNMAHDIIDQIEYDIQEKMGIMLTIHVDPIDTENEDLNNIKKIVEDFVDEIDAPFSPHDFRVVSMEGHMNIIFELEIPYKYDKAKAQKFIIDCRNKIKEYNSNYSCIINIEHSFVL